MLIQINKVLENKPDPKPRPFPNESSHWSDPVDLSIEEIKHHILSGKAVKFGCQSDSSLANKNENVSMSDGTFIDIDDIQPELLEEILLDPVSRKSFLIHHSHSSVPDVTPVYSVHICFQFDRRLNSWEELRDINRKLYSYYKDKYGEKILKLKDGKIDTGCFNPNRFKFGTNRKTALIYESNYKLEIAEVFSWEDTLQQNKKERDVKEQSDKVREVLDGFKEDIFSAEDWLDPSKVFFLYDHEFEKRNSNLINAIQFDGYDARFNEDKKNRSKSFVATYSHNDDVWIWRSRAADIGSNLPEYYYRIANQDFSDTAISKSQWWSGVRLVYEHFNKPELFNKRYSREVPKISVLIREWLDDYRGSIKYEKQNQIVWIYDENKWQIVTYNQVEAIFTGWVNKKYGNGQIIVLDKAYFENFKYQWRNFHDEDRIPFFLEDSYIYPFSNGVYDMNTKIIMPYSPEYKNLFVSPYTYSYDYKEPSDFREYLGIVLDNEDYVQPLIDCMILTLHRKLISTGKAVRCQGKSGSGKSTVCRILASLLNPEQPDKVFNLHHFCNDANYKTYPSLLHTQPFIWFEDVTGYIKNTGNFKLLCNGNFDATLSRKYVTLPSDIKGIQGMFNSICSGQVWITSEFNIWRSGKTSEGELRREYLFLFSNISERAKKLAEKFLTQEWLNNFLLWALNQNPYESSKRLVDESWMNEIKRENKLDYDVVYKFICMQIQFTNNPDDRVSSSDVYQYWERWQSFENDKKSNYISRRQFTTELYRNLNETFGWNKETDLTKSMSNMMIRRIKLIPFEESFSLIDSKQLVDN